MTNENTTQEEVATFGAGCFWCVEAVFQQVPGVKSVTSGYKGGDTENPTYQQVTTGKTGHAEVVRIVYDPSEVSFETLLDVFWRAHDPTQLNRQGADVGTQYRSVIFYHSEAQKEAALASRAKVEAAGRHNRPIVTQIVAAEEFYEAEDYHQNYFRNNPSATYSRFVIAPKLEKLGLEP